MAGETGLWLEETDGKCRFENGVTRGTLPALQPEEAQLLQRQRSLGLSAAPGPDSHRRRRQSGPRLDVGWHLVASSVAGGGKTKAPLPQLLFPCLVFFTTRLFSDNIEVTVYYLTPSLPIAGNKIQTPGGQRPCLHFCP